MVKNLNYQDIETIALIMFSLVFIVLEAFFPKHKDLEKRLYLKPDLAAFILLVAGVNISRVAAVEVYTFLALPKNLLHASSWPFVLKLLTGHLISDFCLYWIHRAMHSQAFLWRTHQFHHSVEVLYWFSGFRTSFMHLLIYAFPQILVGFYFFDFTPLEAGIAFSFGVISNLFTHSNLKLPQWLSLHYILVTPDFHHPHHSQMGTRNKNFGNVFTIWDKIFGTYVDPSQIRSDFKYGLKEKPPQWRMMIGL
jgi:sterol desaturase/sphingolipid hydroxylase (fatty acid hydroxylase superfamily)